MHLGEQLVDRLIGYGITHIFGCPGGQTLPLYNGLAKRQDKITHVLMHDERSAAFAADGYARAAGRLSVCDATVGPGASNLVSGLTEAYASAIPVLAIVSDIPRAWEHRRHFGGASQAFEQRRFLEGCVKWYGRVETAGNLAEILHACIRIATSGRPGPVVLEIPDDVFTAQAVPAPFEAAGEWTVFPRLRPGADPAAVQRAADRIAESIKPIIIAGGGALYAAAGAHVLELAEALRCPVATTMSGKGVIPETHPLAIGVAGRFGLPMANALMAESDCAVFIGSKTGQGTTLGWAVPALSTPVVHIDVDPEELGRNYHDTVAIPADAAVGTAALAAAVRSRVARAAWDLGRVAALRRQWWDGPVEYRQEPVPGILKPQDVTRVMRSLMGERDLLVSDASLSSGWAAGRWQARTSGRQLFAPRGMARLGWGLPAAVGVAAATRERPGGGRVVCLAGDGGWAYSMAEVETAARMRLPVIAVVLNNSTLAWIRHSAASRFPDGVVSDGFLDCSYAEAAHALGATVERVDGLGAFESAFRKATSDETPHPWVIETISCGVETPVVNAPAQAKQTVNQGGY